jgi:hypothetical protein
MFQRLRRWWFLKWHYIHRYDFDSLETVGRLRPWKEQGWSPPIMRFVCIECGLTIDASMPPNDNWHRA